MGAAPLVRRWPTVPRRSKRLLALARDDTLVLQIRRGNEAAFEVVFERHGAGILGFCRHMLGSREEAEDAAQQTFAAAFRGLRRHDERALALKPWLYTIARNRCISMLRARPQYVAEQPEPATAGLAEQVEHRAELRDLLRDLRLLPTEQRAALLLSELGDLSHAEVGQVLGCEVARVKALVYRARSGLLHRRAAREAPCAEIRDQLENVRGGSLRRNQLRHHLSDCAGCRAYREQIKHQRRLLAAALPVAPAASLKSSVLAAPAGGASTGGGLAATGLTGLGGLGAGTAAKVAAVGVLAGGSVVAGKAVVVDRPADPPAPRKAVSAPAPPRPHGAAAHSANAYSAATSRAAPTRSARRGRKASNRPRGPSTPGAAPVRKSTVARRQRPAGRQGARGRTGKLAPMQMPPRPAVPGRALGHQKSAKEAAPKPRGRTPNGSTTGRPPPPRGNPAKPKPKHEATAKPKSPQPGRGQPPPKPKPKHEATAKPKAPQPGRGQPPPKPKHVAPAKPEPPPAQAAPPTPAPAAGAAPPPAAPKTAKKPN